MVEQNIRSVRELWRDYLFLTKEMVKFLIKKDLDIFYELLDQRERLQKIIDEQPPNDFVSSPAGRQLLADIKREDQFITLKLQGLLHQAKQQHTMARAYDNLGATIAGRRMDHQG